MPWGLSPGPGPRPRRAPALSPGPGPLLVIARRVSTTNPGPDCALCGRTNGLPLVCGAPATLLKARAGPSTGQPLTRRRLVAMRVTVARIGKAHGLKGEVSVELRTDIPEDRLYPGAVLDTDPPTAGPLTVQSVRQQAGRWYVRFEQIADRTAAENARGIELLVEADEDEEDDAWFIGQLVGIEAVRPDGTPIGTVVEVLALPAQDVLVVRQPSGFRAMVPIVEEFVPEVDIDAGRITLTPPYGLLEGEEPEDTGETRGAQ